MKLTKKNIFILISVVLVAVVLVACIAIMGAPKPTYGNAVENATHADKPKMPEAATYSGLTDREKAEIAELGSNASLAFTTYTPRPESEFEYKDADGGVAITKYVGMETVIIIPDSIGGRAVTGICAGAFENTSVRALCVPESVTGIESGALRGCGNLSTLKLPAVDLPDGASLGYIFGAESLDDNCDIVPKNLSMVILTAGDTLSDNYFYNFKGLRAAILPGSVKSIGDLAFFRCESLTYVELPHGLCSIGEYAFCECKSLASLSLDLPNLEKIGLGAFYGCRGMRELTLPFIGGGERENAYFGYIFGAESVNFGGDFVPGGLGRVVITGGKTIEDKAFYKCGSIVEIVLPDGLQTIGIRSFYGCVSIREITLPESVESLGDDAFFGCINLETVNMSDRVLCGMQAFYGSIYENLEK